MKLQSSKAWILKPLLFVRPRVPASVEIRSILFWVMSAPVKQQHLRIAMRKVATQPLFTRGILFMDIKPHPLPKDSTCPRWKVLWALQNHSSLPLTVFRYQDLIGIKRWRGAITINCHKMTHLPLEIYDFQINYLKYESIWICSTW
jgi:hypothetical protein